MNVKKSLMIVGINTGTVPLFRVQSQVKINTQYQVDYILKHFFIINLPCLFEWDEKGVFSSW